MLVAEDVVSQHGCVCERLQDAVHEARVAEVEESLETWCEGRRHCIYHDPLAQIKGSLLLAQTTRPHIHYIASIQITVWY